MAANQWVKVELYGQNGDGEQRRYTIADGIAVSKGDLLYLTDARQVSGARLGVKPIAGVAAEEKTINDGATSISCWTSGIFEVVASGAINVGVPVSAQTDNCPSMVTAASVIAGASGAVLGYALEEAADGETINVRLRL